MFGCFLGPVFWVLLHNFWEQTCLPRVRKAAGNIWHVGRLTNRYMLGMRDTDEHEGAWGPCVMIYWAACILIWSVCAALWALPNYACLLSCLLSRSFAEWPWLRHSPTVAAVRPLLPWCSGAACPGHERFHTREMPSWLVPCDKHRVAYACNAAVASGPGPVDRGLRPEAV